MERPSFFKRASVRLQKMIEFAENVFTLSKIIELAPQAIKLAKKLIIWFTLVVTPSAADAINNFLY